jgi:hypothetical protein
MFFLYMRGVFSVLVWLLFCSSSVQAAHFGGELTATVGMDGASSALTFDLAKDLSWCRLKWGFDADIGMSSSLRTNIATRWEVALPVTSKVQVLLNHNQDHFTSSDIFRIINKNNYTAESYSTSFQTEQLRVGFLRQILFRNRDVVDAVFAQSNLNIGGLSLTGMQMRFAGISESGTADVFQGEGRLGAFDVVGARGWQSDSKGEESQGWVFELKKEGDGPTGCFVVQRIDPGFLSPLAMTNRYTPDRQGWKLELLTEHNGLQLGFNIRRHKNVEGTRDYKQLSWKLDAKDKHTRVEWRIQPTPAFIISYDRGGSLFQLDALNSTLRTDLKVWDTAVSFRLDAARSIARLECRFGRVLEWRVITKYDFLLHRSHYSILIRHSGGDTAHHLQLEIGQYDRGNMNAGFNNPGSFCISWAWKF